MVRDTNNKVLAIIFSDKEEFLLLRTNPKTMKEDHWYVVTGGVKKGEEFEEAVRREVAEETGLEILEVQPTALSFDYEWPRGSGKMKYEKAFLVRVKHNEPKITRWEHLEWKWLGKEDFIEQIDWYGESKDGLRGALKGF
jgi:NADH pyrophosphatase NudC (nudix superfamily)